MRDLPEWLEEFKENLVDESVPGHGHTPASSSREPASEQRAKVVSGKHSFLLTSRRTEIARSVKGPKLQGVLAENALAQPYLEQKLLVT